MKNYQSLFRKACLVQLSTSIWACSKVLNQSILKEKIGEDNDWLRGRKFSDQPRTSRTHQNGCASGDETISKSSHCPFRSHRSTWCPRITLPLLMNVSSISRSGSGIRSVNLNPCTAKLVRKLKAVLGDLFNETDYPEISGPSFGLNIVI
jgi:hypothetical protein